MNTTNYHDNRDAEQMHGWHESRIKALKKRVEELTADRDALQKKYDTATWLLAAQEREIAQLKRKDKE